ncbi:hypothetical protein AQUCO_00100851v1 [Aquilegia coerulea]|uniref:separase n=1 Tax=Aquilegia coerulea TaxID=218851 RepID=A0A2G5FCA5_AQUCA|nr:hypothetical protein AQUCO_00100851v1 [Aquilegia coerulea]
MDSVTDSLLISRLKNSNYRNFRQDFLHYLNPFSNLLSSSSQTLNKQNEIRLLGKQFLPFLNLASKLLPDRLTDLMKRSSQDLDNKNKEDIASELFQVNEFCLECLSLIFASDQLQMVVVNERKVQLLHCYQDWGRYVHAEILGFRILSSLRRPVKKAVMIAEEKFLPDVLVEENENPDFALVLVHIVLCLIKCLYKIQRKDDAAYQRVLSLVHQIRPWFRVLDSKVFEKAQHRFVCSLYQCTLFMLKQDSYLDQNLVCKFCMTTLEYSKSSQKDQFFKRAHAICSDLCSQWNSRSSLIVDILKCVLTFTVCVCKVEVKDTVNECFEIVHYCSDACKLAGSDSCRDVGQNLGEMASSFFEVLVPSNSILRLYAAGLCFMESSFQRTCIESECSLAELLTTTSSVRSWDDHMTDVLHSLASYFHADSNNCCSLKCSLRCTSEHGRVSFLTYLKALAFFCAPFAKLIFNAMESVLTGKISEMLSLKIVCILDACHQLCDTFLHHFTCTSETDNGDSSGFEETLSYAAVTALIISFRTDKNVKRSMQHIDCLVSRWWNRWGLMKFFIASICNIGCCLYNTHQMKQASDVFELCCRLTWTCIGNLEARHHDWSEEAITHIVTQACSRTVTLLLDTLRRCGSSDLSRIVEAALVNWAVVANLYESLDGPIELVRKWVQIDVDAEDNTPILYSLLCKSLRKNKSSITITKRTSGIILEQELLAYEEMEAQNMNLCQTMQLKITEILLRDIYVTEDTHRSKVLIKKGRLHRARGIVNLKSCIDCLSEAISILVSFFPPDLVFIYFVTHSNCFQLILIFLCFYLIACDEEPQPNLKVIINDIRCALKLWLSIDWSVDGHYELVNENVIQLLCCIADLLSVKGHFHFQDDICKLIIVLLKKGRVPPEKCFAMLWADRRLTHALCTKPVDENIITSFAQHIGAGSNSDTVGIWLSHIKKSPALLVGFRQKYSLYDSILSQVGHCLSGSPLGYNVTVDEIEEVASALKPGVSVVNFNFLAGYLYHDLCERLVLSGRMTEALSFAIKALSLRFKLLSAKFICSNGNKPLSIRETDELEVIGSVASEVWPHMHSRKLEECNLSQWNVLQCYLESILQVGSVHEALGNVGNAEFYLTLGKKISSKKRLQIFEVSFASALGEIFCKKQSWDLAGIELKRANKILVDTNSLISCRQCRLILEVTLDKQIADLNKRRSDGTKTSLHKRSSAALVMYRKALNKLKQFEWNLVREQNSRITRSRRNCIGECGEIYEMHEIFWQSISMLFDRKPFSETYLGSHSVLLGLIGKERPGDVFAIERASILYNLSWFCLKNIHFRTTCCGFSCIQLSSLISWLLQAFMLSCEVPLLAQKVSRLLATLFLLSTSGEKPFCLPPFPGKALCESHWAAFFHQVSLGSYFNHQLSCSGRIRVGHGSQFAALTSTSTEMFNLLRFSPGCIADLENLILDFFRLLPATTVICISVFGNDYASLLWNVLPDNVSSPAWVLLSRLNSDYEPTVMLLPSDVIPKDMDHDGYYITFSKGIDSSKKWTCPWGCSVVDDIAPEFKVILEENYLSSSSKQKSQWWARRDKLNDRLEKFLRNIEESWFGPWKCLLVGDPFDSTCLDSAVLKMTSALKCKFEFKANENLLKVILGGSSSVSETVECICQMLLQKGCITRWGIFPNKKCDLSSFACAQVDSLSGMLHQLIVEATQELEAECINRLPIIMVPDSDVQMLPWENLPVLRKAEVYRMPSVGSILVLIKENSHGQKQIARADGTFSSIDPLDAFYFLDPHGNFSCTGYDFKDWLRDKKLEGTTGTLPSVEELVLALETRDLFLYFGHGDATQYIPESEIAKLHDCAATLLMGCSSGSLKILGSYNPRGVVLSYLLAGSPAIVANLWDVTDRDVDKFGKALVGAWLQEREAFPIDCNESKLVEGSETVCCLESSEGSDGCSIRGRRDTLGTRPRIASFMSQAREACKLAYLNGASPVCYGLPTGICIRKCL